MKLTVVLAAVYATFLSFSLLSLFFGDTGVAALEKLRLRNNTLETNLADLQSKQADLADTLESLRSNPESVVIAARSLGMYRNGDNVVYFKNLKPVHSLPDAGQVLYLNPVRRTGDGVLRVFSIAAGVIVMLMSFVIHKVGNARRKG